LTSSARVRDPEIMPYSIVAVGGCFALVGVLTGGCTQIGGPYDGDDMSPNTEAYEASADSGGSSGGVDDASATAPTSTDPGTTTAPGTDGTTGGTDPGTTTATTDPTASTTTDPSGTTDVSTTTATDAGTTTDDPTTSGSSGTTGAT
jgi:hypothetical protein